MLVTGKVLHRGGLAATRCRGGGLVRSPLCPAYSRYFYYSGLEGYLCQAYLAWFVGVRGVMGLTVLRGRREASRGWGFTPAFGRGAHFQ
jgi:hypothetical protein